MVNENAVYLPDPPCTRCGHQGFFDFTTRSPPAIDETMLDRQAPSGSWPGKRGWELVNLPYGQALMSHRLAQLLVEHEVRGFALGTVLNAARQSWLGGAEVLSRHPGRGALLSVSQRVFAIFKDTAGLRRGDPLMACHTEHDCRGSERPT